MMAQMNFSGTAVSILNYRAIAARKIALAGATGAAVLAVSMLALPVLAVFSGPAQAQVYFRSWNERFVYYDDYPEFIGRREVRDILAEHGYRLRGTLRRNGRVYVADVSDQRGRPYRVLVDAIEGEIVRRFQSRLPALPPRPAGRRYSNADPLGEPQADGPRDLTPQVLTPQRRGPGSRIAPADTPRAAKQKDLGGKSRKTGRPVRKPDSEIARRPLPPVEPPKPAAPPIVPETPTVANPPASTAIKPPEQKQSPVEQQANVPILPPPEKPAPVIVPKAVPSESAPQIEAARPQPSDPTAEENVARTNAAGNAAATDAKSSDAKSSDAKSSDAKSSDAKPADTKSSGITPGEPESNASQTDEAGQRTPKVRIVGPPITAHSAPKDDSASASTDSKVKVAPLDNPGKRRDIEKPVGVAPLQ